MSVRDPFSYGMLNPGLTPRRTKISQDGTSKIEVYDLIANTTSELEKEKNKKFKSSQFSGIVLSYQNIVGYQLLARTSPAFRNSLGITDDMNSVNEQFLEYTVYIPEINGYFPSFRWEEYEKLSKEFGAKSPKEIIELNKKTQPSKVTKSKLDKYLKILIKLSRFPKFYTKSADGQDTAGVKKVCLVEFPDMNYLSYGKFIGFK